MAPQKLTIEEQFERDLRGDFPTPSKPANRKSIPASRRPKLPMGLSYHPTPQGLKYRIRIRSEKKLKTLGLTQPLDEIFDDIGTAEKRLLDLKYTGIYSHDRVPSRMDQLARENEELRAMVALLFKKQEEQRQTAEPSLPPKTNLKF